MRIRITVKNCANYFLVICYLSYHSSTHIGNATKHFTDNAYLTYDGNNLNWMMMRMQERLRCDRGNRKENWQTSNKIWQITATQKGIPTGYTTSSERTAHRGYRHGQCVQDSTNCFVAGRFPNLVVAVMIPSSITLVASASFAGTAWKGPTQRLRSFFQLTRSQCGLPRDRRGGITKDQRERIMLPNVRQLGISHYTHRNTFQDHHINSTSYEALTNWRMFASAPRSILVV